MSSLLKKLEEVQSKSTDLVWTMRTRAKVQSPSTRKVYGLFVIMGLALCLGVYRMAFQNKTDSAPLPMASPATSDFYEQYRQALAILKQNNFVEAKLKFDKLLEKRPSSVPTMTNLALVFKKMGQVDEAEKLLQNAVEQDPTHATAHNNLGMILLEKNDLALAKVSFEKALSLEPEYAVAALNLGHALESMGNIAAAIKYYKIYLSTSTDPSPSIKLVSTRIRRLVALANPGPKEIPSNAEN